MGPSPASMDRPTAAAHAVSCAERVLPIFEAACPTDDRPRRAIEAARAHVPEAEARAAAEAAHAAARAARDVVPGEAGRAVVWAARAAGHAVAAVHVARHAVHAAACAAWAEGASDERDWQLERFRQLLEDLRS